MKARELSALLRMVKKMDDIVLVEIASMPASMERDYLDRVIVVVALGERQWRLS